ncbi:MAG: DNA primase [Alphaproteobacteria bacterium]|nr:DNA primase [Alphaproteobacteria bacterium]
MSISPRFLDEIRTRLSLSEVIGRRVKVTRAGREYKACCPFHHEKSPSFTINDDKQFFHCFGCGAHGDVVGFVMRHDNLSFPDAVEMLAAEAGLQMPKQTPQEVEKAQKQKDLYALVEETCRYFEGCLRESKNVAALDYLLGRGLTEETIAGFRLGFSPEDGQALRKHLTAQGFTDKDMIAAGVMKASVKGKEPYAFFRERVMFPVSDRRGRVVAFGGRILPDHLRGPQRGDFKPPKYINSTETPLFHKGSMLYNEPRARHSAGDGVMPVVVEGYLDVIACEQAGVKGAVAPMGTALTEAQIETLWKMIPGDLRVPVLCFDGDNAGRKAAERAADRVMPMLKPGMSVSFAFLPEGEDPDTLIRSGGAAAMAGILEGRQSLADFLWQSHVGGRTLDTPEARAGAVKRLQQEVLRIADHDVQAHYKTLFQQRVSEAFFSRPTYSRAGPARQDFKRGKRSAVSGRTGPVLRRPASQMARVYPRVLLAGLINHPHIFDAVEEHVAHLVLVDPVLRRLRDAVVVILSGDPPEGRDELLEILKNEGFVQEVDDILNESVYVHASFCSSLANSDVAEEKWLAYWKDGQALGVRKEIQAGVKRAFDTSSEEEEEKLRQMIAQDAVDQV